MKNILTGFLLLSCLMGISISSFAHPGRTNSSGCHTCKTNCPKWGYEYGEYHCHLQDDKKEDFFSEDNIEKQSHQHDHAQLSKFDQKKEK